MATERYLIVNADDFGQSACINQGIIQSFQQGIVTSASLMVRWQAADSAATYAREHPELSVGLHIDLGEWAYREGEWVSVYTVVAENDSAAVAAEVSRQLALFRTLVGRNPTHLDSHQHIHRSEPLRSILLEISRTLRVPLRHFGQVNYCGEFYGQTATGEPYPEGLTIEKLMQTLTAVQAGTTELGCHPGMGNDVNSMYRSELAAEELKTLCDPRIRKHLVTQNIELRSFMNFASSLC